MAGRAYVWRATSRLTLSRSCGLPVRRMEDEIRGQSNEVVENYKKLADEARQAADAEREASQLQVGRTAEAGPLVDGLLPRPASSWPEGTRRYLPSETRYPHLTAAFYSLYIIGGRGSARDAARAADLGG